MTDTDTRTAYTKGLRLLADLLDNNPDLPLPYHGSTVGLNWIEFDRDSAAAFARLIPGTVTKTPRDDAIDLKGQIAGLKVQFIASREAVCERVVLGTHEVTVAAQPAVKATKATTMVVEDVEWICGSLLAESVSA